MKKFVMRPPRLAGVHQDGVPEPESVTWPSVRDQDALPNVVADHEIDGLGAEQPRAVVIAAVEDHLVEFEIVGRCR
jgi:hypothetical protein